eukprot:jgi/Psemu1/41993/gm1.41993_g
MRPAFPSLRAKGKGPVTPPNGKKGSSFKGCKQYFDHSEIPPAEQDLLLEGCQEVYAPGSPGKPLPQNGVSPQNNLRASYLLNLEHCMCLPQSPLPLLWPHHKCGMCLLPQTPLPRSWLHHKRVQVASNPTTANYPSYMLATHPSVVLATHTSNVLATSPSNKLATSPSNVLAPQTAPSDVLAPPHPSTVLTRPNIPTQSLHIQYYK